LSRRGIDCEALVVSAMGAAPLPDDWPAAALWWRVARELAAAKAADLELAPRTNPLTDETLGIGDCLDSDLAWAAQVRRHLDPPEPDDAESRRLQDRAWDIECSPVTLARIAHLNELATTYYEDRFATSWAADYLDERLGHGIAADLGLRAGCSPRRTARRGARHPGQHRPAHRPLP
jgi:hypothetical protein